MPHHRERACAMKAAVIPEAHVVEVREIDRPSPGPGEALVKVEAVGVCGSDLHAYEGTQPFFQYPEIGGHEVVGEVVEMVPHEEEAREIPGRRHVRPLREGARVVLDPSIPCGRCYPCRTGRYNCCENMRVLGVHAPGAFAEFMVAPVGCLHAIPESISADAAVMAEPLSIGVQSSTRGRVTMEDTVLVIGAGTIGLSVLQVCKARGARVAVSDLSEGRLSLANEMGADVTVNPQSDDPRDALDEFSGGSGPAVVIEAVGTPKTVQQALDVVAASGRVIMLGLCTEEICIEGALMVRKELDFLGSRLHGGTLPQAISLIEANEVHPEKLVTHHMRLSDLERAFELMIAEPDTTLKVILTP
ncbi:MAG: alcohol dehydrogenase catalytic domain-containing protein [Armatimonadia bacterium]|nr:alcohol dehydrogenase catalytic domain-containing protein [Armatimonadia bacterium]